MARVTNYVSITPTKKSSSQGQGGRGRSTKISMSTMNKHKKRSHKKYIVLNLWFTIFLMLVIFVRQLIYLK